MKPTNRSICRRATYIFFADLPRNVPPPIKGARAIPGPYPRRGSTYRVAANIHAVEGGVAEVLRW